MREIKIFCTSIKYYRILDKLPRYVKPIGLGKNVFPSNWIDEKVGANLSNLNPFYGELTGIYWLWKNQTTKMKSNDLIGICHYRKLWLNKIFFKKQKWSTSSLYSNLLKAETLDKQNVESVQVQPIIFKNKTLLEDFKQIHQTEILSDSLNFLDGENRSLFYKHLNNKIFYPLNMFVSRVDIFNKYCQVIFPWLEQCFKLCEEKKLCVGYNKRLPAFLAERFTSFWFSQYNSKIELSYARLGKAFLSNKLNYFINPIKLPLTFRMYPTLHNY